MSIVDGQKEELETTQVLPYFKNCIEETDWFTKKEPV